MKKFIILIIFYVFSLSLFAQQYEAVKKFDPTRSPEKDLKIAVEYAQKTNKRILLDVGGEWCIWCHRMDEFIESHKEIKEFLEKHFVVVKVNYSKENKNEKFLSNYPQIPGYPHIFVLDKDGKFLHSQDTGVLEKDKDYDEIKFMEFLQKWALK
ncbi:Thiol-disulfide isomerase/thioredoxin domain protein [Ignavibacterium album JCM 16511]|uniref:Thiol-disulfide isomerase/thioredoxin domain protein n=1 Tax=Ignavibacterium album (strain DSM 19864 / JCM 16511 / NBRC 101810 / Mat9-16) TaxID=945713 RepID=I0AG41_IGNAJ|nr:thioredoxin family protein [Ignavibacterium album]AFH47948.1 Thiol-disulfide isomerase/thioredoxin domain protein [Ignavibacterium album JCM 16511]